jgi:hypothetical protein
MDVYGRPAMNVPNYKGVVDSKLDTFKKYRYALCFENLYHPIWSQGYLTEKMIDCMVADCVPVYYGCSNIESYVPENCFIDFRQFQSFAELDHFLAGLTDDDYLRYVKNIRSFLREYNAPSRCSVHRVYEQAIQLFHESVDSSATWPNGFWQQSELREKVAYMAMAGGLKGRQFIRPLFNILRKFDSRRNR